MPPRECYVSQIEMRPVNPDGTYGEVIKWDLSEPITFEDESVIETSSYTIPFGLLRDTPVTFTGELKLPHKKMSRKTFKKWLMSRGFHRDLAEWFCRVVKTFKGKQSYQSLYFNGLFSSTPQDLFNILFDTIFPFNK